MLHKNGKAGGEWEGKIGEAFGEIGEALNLSIVNVKIKPLAYGKRLYSVIC